MYLIGDIGNTEIKLCILNNKLKKKRKIYIKTNLVNEKYLKKKLSFLKPLLKNFKYVLFCSVVPKIYKMFKNFFKFKLNLPCYELKELNLKSLVKILVNRKQVGSDRLSNAISVIDYNNNYIIVDLGTATTFDVIKKKEYLGGIIAPGPILSLENLIKKASLIPKVKLKKMTNIIGKNTSSSVKSGFYWGYVGLINNIVNLIINNTKTKYKIIITGGLANMFKNSLSHKSKIDKDVTLKGLIKVIKNQII